MRYVAKIHVLDVLDRIVVSGYVVDCDNRTDPDHEAFEFSYEVASYGHDSHLDWLVGALYSALLEMHKTPQRRV